MDMLDLFFERLQVLLQYDKRYVAILIIEHMQNMIAVIQHVP
jgi:hypothetical protein